MTTDKEKLLEKATKDGTELHDRIVSAFEDTDDKIKKYEDADIIAPEVFLEAVTELATLDLDFVPEEHRYTITVPIETDVDGDDEGTLSAAIEDFLGSKTEEYEDEEPTTDTVLTDTDEALAKIIESDTDMDSFSYPELDTPSEASEEETLGIIDKIKGKKKMRTKEDVGMLKLFMRWFEKYLNSVYQAFYTSEGKVTLKPGHEGGFVNLDNMEIVLFEKLIGDMWESGIPPLLVFYHEIGHVLYTTKELTDYGKTLTPEVFTLLNWIEDFYIEDRLMNELYFIKPYIKMLHEVVPEHIDDWDKPHFSLHYYYTFEGLTPRWMDKTSPPIARTFKKYIEQLKHLRSSFTSRFGREKFIRMFEEFYAFCIEHKILTKRTPSAPTEPRPAEEGEGEGKGRGSAKGSGGTHTGDGGGEFKKGSKEEKGAEGDTYADDEGEDVPESRIIRPPFKPLDKTKGFDPMFKELMDMLEKEFDKSMYDDFKLAKKGKPQLVPRTRATMSPRSMVDPIAIVTHQPAIYLEYTVEDFAYTAYNLFIDVSGSVGHNKTFNTLGKKIIEIISAYPYAVYGYGNDVTKWDQKKIDSIMDLTCRDGTESPIIGDIILEKKELGNLNIILSDGDLSNLSRRPDIKEITNQYLFIFIVAAGSWGGYAKPAFDDKQVFTLNSIEDLPKGLAKMQKYIREKGL